MYQSLPTGKEANQTAFEAVQVSGYNCRSDATAHALTLQLPLEGKLLRGGVTGVLKTANGQWLHCQQHGAIPDFYISTREVNMLLPCRCGVSAVLACCLRMCQLGECAALKFCRHSDICLQNSYTWISGPQQLLRNLAGHAGQGMDNCKGILT